MQEDANVTPPSRLPVFLLTPPADSQFSEEFGPADPPLKNLFFFWGLIGGGWI